MRPPAEHNMADLKQRVAELEIEREKRLRGELAIAAAKKRVDEELLRLQAIQNFVSTALRIKDNLDLMEVFIESIVESYECEKAFVLKLGPDAGRLTVEQSFDGTCARTTVSVDEIQNLGGLAEAYQGEKTPSFIVKKFDVANCLFCKMVNSNNELTGAVIAGNSKKSLGTYPEITAEHVSSFSVLVSEASSLQENLKLETKVQNYVSELEQKQLDLEMANTKLGDLAKSFERFVPKDFLMKLGRENILEISIGDQISEEMTVLFCDIRRFTSISEKLQPEEIFKLLNNYLASVVPQIRAHGGFIDKYIGDAIMALYPDPSKSIEGSIDMLKALYEFNDNYNLDIEIGVGLHTGHVMLGTIGDAQSMQCTVLSDAVNLASRIEGLTKQFGCKLIVSESTFNAAYSHENNGFRSLGRVKVKGREDPVELFQIFDAEPPEKQIKYKETKSIFSSGVQFYQIGEVLSAKTCFKKALSVMPDDLATQIYISNCEQLGEKVYSGWEGCLVIREK